MWLRLLGQDIRLGKEAQRYTGFVSGAGEPRHGRRRRQTGSKNNEFANNIPNIFRVTQGLRMGRSGEGRLSSVLCAVPVPVHLQIGI